MSRRKNLSIAQIRIQKELEEITSSTGYSITIPDPNNILIFQVEVIPPTGIYTGKKFLIEFKIPEDFPFERPIVKCLTQVWHPNIDPTGAICLSLLKEGYNPTLSLTFLVIGLQYLFSSPNPEDPLNKEAANQYINNYQKFLTVANEYMSLYCKK